MTSRLAIFLLLLTNKFCIQAQTPSSVFHSHVQTCHYIGTTEQDFVIELFNDSTIKISLYTSRFVDQYNSVLRYTFLGKYLLANDTIKVTFLTKNSECKYKQKKSNTFNLTFEYPTSIFILNSTTISSNGGIFPTLKKSTSLISNQLDLEFKTWGKLKFGKKIFGITKS